MSDKQRKSIDGIVRPKPTSDAEAKPTAHWRWPFHFQRTAPTWLVHLRQNAHQKKKVAKKSNAFMRGVFAGIGIVVVFGASILFWSTHERQSTSNDPISSRIASSVQFTLYYPTRLPSGFHFNAKSVTEPQSGVIVFDLEGLGNKKIYFSEEARPTTYDIGGFYAKLQDLKEIGVNGGAIAVGRVKGTPTEVASLANNSTWILSNTNSNVPFDQLITMLKSIIPA